MKKNIRHCPICAGRKKKIVKHIKLIVPDDFILPSEYDIVACKNCGFIYNDVPNSKSFDEYYANYKENTNFTIPSEDAYALTKEKGKAGIIFLQISLKPRQRLISQRQY